MISIWEAETFYAPQNVLIIGGGFVGLWSALQLKKRYPTARITIVDRGQIPTGASTRNAGFACFGSLSELAHDVATMGLDKTLALAEMRFKGLAHIEKTFRRSSIDFVRCGGYELFAPDAAQPPAQLAHTMAQFNKHLKQITGASKTYKQADKKIAAFGFANTTHLVKNKFEGYLHAGKLVQSLMQNVAACGVHQLGNTEIINLEADRNGVRVTTSTNQLLRADKVLVCTNAFAKELLPQLDVVPARGQVLVTSPLQKLPWSGAFHFDEGYYYFRNLGDRVLLGGARNSDFLGEQTTVFETSTIIQEKLEHFLRTVILPNNNEHYTIDYRWAGIMGMGFEKSPIVTEIQPNLFCAVRMSGMGVALAPVVAETIANKIRLD